MDRRIIILFIAISLSTIISAQTIAPVKVLKAEVSEIAEIVEGHGIIKPLPLNDIKISAISPMRIENILVKPGDFVKKGQIVIKLQRDHSIELAVKKSEINLEYVKVNYQRAKNLFENGVVAKAQLESAKTDYELAKSEYDLQKQSFEYAVANSEIRSPIAGVVSSINGVIGQIADPTLDLIHIVNMSKTIATIGIESEDLSKIKIGQKAQITIPNVTNGKIFDGMVIRQNREIDPATQLVHIWIQIKNPSKILHPGMFTEANVFVKIDKNIISLPHSAVLNDNGGDYVFVVKNKINKKIYVETGIKVTDNVEINVGINVGDTVVYLGNYELEDGMGIKIEK